MRWGLLPLVVALALTGCLERRGRAVGASRDRLEGGARAGDAGSDAGFDDAGLTRCSSGCRDPLQSRCNTETGYCEACEDGTQCPFWERRVCVPGEGCFGCSEDTPCADSTLLCDITTRACVECFSGSGELRCKERGEVCDQETQRCVECLVREDCTRKVAGKVCDTKSNTCVECTAEEADACQAQGQVCEAGGTRCVECNEDAECGDPMKARCDAETHSCVPCGSHEHCEHLGPDTGACFEGTCVPCTGDHEQGCGDYVCDVANRQCDPTRRKRAKSLCNRCVLWEGKAACEAAPGCVSDLECQEGQYCVDDRAGGGLRVCLQGLADERELCPRPTVGANHSAINASGESVVVCAYRTEATCKAHEQYGSAGKCGVPDSKGELQPDHSVCGVEGIDDGYCLWVDGLGYGCTVPCLSVEDCPPEAVNQLCVLTGDPDFPRYCAL